MQFADDGTVSASKADSGDKAIMFTPDYQRSQGQVGLFVPDAGYPFGDIPEWLLEQRWRQEPYYIESRQLWPLGLFKAPSD